MRGNWRNTDVSAPFIVAKCCHDMDILLYLLGDKHCVSLSSVGDLSFFNSDHYDKQKMASRCIDCSIQKECPFDCVRIYDTPLVDWFHFDCSTPEKTKESFQDSPYGRCVFQCDNNVCDHQTVSLKFDKGVTATFNASAFTKYTSRTIKIMCEYGEIRGNEHSKIIEVQRWDSDEIKTIRLTDEETSGNHAGGDEGFIKYFMDAYINEKDFSSSIALSIESHVMAYAAEMSRLKDGEMKNIPSLWAELTKK